MMALSVLTACSAVPQALRVETATTGIERPKKRPPLPNPEPINTLPVEWKVMKEGDVVPDGAALFCLSPRGYESISRNQAEILRWVEGAHWRLRYYRGEGEAEGLTDDEDTQDGGPS